MTIAHAPLISRIGEIMRSLTTPAFDEVIAGEPLGFGLGGPYGAYWFLRRESEVGNVRGDFDVTEVYQIGAWWPRRPERATLEDFELEIADAAQALQTAFRADSLLNGGAGDPGLTPMITLTTATVGYGRFPEGPGATYRSLMFELHALDRQGEGTTL